MGDSKKNVDITSPGEMEFVLQQVTQGGDIYSNKHENVNQEE
jgi:hypothetical protein